MVDISVYRRNACVVVLGDIGRSPRMKYHTLSLLENNYNVDLIGYLETTPLDGLNTHHRKCRIHELCSVPVTNLTPKLKLIFKTIWQTLSLLIALISIRRPNFILVQNPPGIPTLIVCYLYAILTRTKLIIDWHNYTYTILALGMPGGENGIFCRFAKWLERYFGSKSDAHLCVTKAMKTDLENTWDIKPVTVLYDRPPIQFQPITLSQKHELFMKLSTDYPQFMAKCYSDLKQSGIIESTILTQKTRDGNILQKTERVGIVVSSTSWTPDEDFNILFKALKDYEDIATKHHQKYPSLLCIITGKGPQKEQYETQIKKLQWTKVSIITPWLENDDYPLLLASADLGVCLHYSSSGLDLPMKVVDMFGCGLPVCAHNYNCINELVVHGQNGFVFNNHLELSEQLQLWFESYPNNPNMIELKNKFRADLEKFQSLRWNQNWNQTALPVFNSFI